MALVKFARRQGFSDFFRSIDPLSHKNIKLSVVANQRYLDLTARWKVPYEKKQAKKLERAENPLQPALPSDNQLLIHTTTNSVDIEPLDLFAVIKVRGQQYKVTRDSKLILDQINDIEVGQQVVFEDVLLVGAQDWTCIGRPLIGGAKVHATIEERTLTDKEIVFKYKRRKDYHSNQGHRSERLVLRIDDILYEITVDAVNQAEQVNLTGPLVGL